MKILGLSGSLRRDSHNTRLLAGTRKLRLILDVGIKFARRLPKQAERPLAAGVIPNARCHDTMLARHACHLTKSHDGSAMK